MTKNMSQPFKRNLWLNGKRTTLQLEQYNWQNSEWIADQTNRRLADVMNYIWAHKGNRPMAPSVRLFLMFYYTYFAEHNLIRATRPLSEDEHAMKAAEAMPDLAMQSYDHALLSLAAATAR